MVVTALLSAALVIVSHAAVRIQPRPQPSGTAAAGHSALAIEPVARLMTVAGTIRERTAPARAGLVDMVQSFPQSGAHRSGRRWLVAMIMGCAAAITVRSARDLLNPTIRTPHDIASRLHLPLLGAVPLLPRGRTPWLSSTDVPHDFGESFRRVRTALIARFTAPHTKLLVVTSAHFHEGKTMVATNIAAALAFGGARVLVIDADLERPRLHQPLRLANERGLAQVLTGQSRLRDVVQTTPDPNLLAITAGRASNRPSELLSSERLLALLSIVGQGAFDWVLIDAPPALEAAGATFLTRSAAGTIYVIDAATARQRDAQRGLEAIEGDRPGSVMVVLNKARAAAVPARHAGLGYARADSTATI
jgi:capsular exopolysaccharide synthesis family protein